MSRVKKVIQNVKVNLFFHLLYTFIGFFTRKIFLEHLGDEFLGLVGTLQSILKFLNLAELGIGTAIGFALYRPIYENNRDELNKIVGLLGYLYKKIGLAILGFGVVVSLFFGLIFSEVSFSLILVYYCFFAFLISSLLGYFYNFHQSLLKADQKEYIVTKTYQLANIIRQILQAGIAYYYGNLYIWITLELAFSVAYSYIIRRKIVKEYPWLIIHQKTTKEVLKDFKDVIKKVKQVFVHKIAAFVTYSTDQLLIFSLVSIQSVTFFGNYNLIFMMLKNILGKILTGINASVGNLVAENNPNQIKKVFWEMMALRFFIAGFASINLYFLIHIFIQLWIGDKYLLENSIIILMIVNLFISLIRLPLDSFITAYGLFKDTWAPIAEIVINVVISIFFGSIWGIKGIMLGTTISLTLIVLIWKPYFLFKNGFNKSVLSNYWPGFIKLLLAFLISAFLIEQISSYLIKVEVVNYWDWILYAIKLNVLTLLLFFPLLYTNKGFRNIISRIIEQLK